MNSQFNQGYKDSNSTVTEPALFYAPTHPKTFWNKVFWIFYVPIGFLIDLILTLIFWIMSLILPFTYPFIVLIGGNKGLYSTPGIVIGPGDFLYGWDDSQIYLVAGITSIAGIALLVLVILTLKPWYKLHRAMFRHLGGLSV